MERVTDLLCSNEGTVEVALEFGMDLEHRRNVGGRLHAEVQMRCQRCLQPMAVTIDQEIHLGMVPNEAAAQSLPGHYEPLVVTGEPVSLRELVEDELLLALPIAPAHPVGNCAASGAPVQQEDHEADQEAERTNPFSALAHWKRQSD